MSGNVSSQALSLEQALSYASNEFASNLVDFFNRQLVKAQWLYHPISQKWYWPAVWVAAKEFTLQQDNPGAREGGMLEAHVMDSGSVEFSLAR